MTKKSINKTFKSTVILSSSTIPPPPPAPLPSAPPLPYKSTRDASRPSDSDPYSNHTETLPVDHTPRRGVFECISYSARYPEDVHVAPRHSQSSDTRPVCAIRHSRCTSFGGSDYCSPCRQFDVSIWRKDGTAGRSCLDGMAARALWGNRPQPSSWVM